MPERMDESLRRAVREGLPLVVAWMQEDTEVAGAICINVREFDGDSDAFVERLGLGSRPAWVVLNPTGEEFARSETGCLGSYRQATLESILMYYERRKLIERALLDPTAPSEVLAEAFQLFCIQRRYTAADAVLERLKTAGVHPLCSQIRQLAELAVSMGMLAEAKPLFHEILESSPTESSRLEAWSRLIWCTLTLGQIEEARRLASYFEVPNCTYQQA